MIKVMGELPIFPLEIMCEIVRFAPWPAVNALMRASKVVADQVDLGQYVTDSVATKYPGMTWREFPNGLRHGTSSYRPIEQSYDIDVEYDRGHPTVWTVSTRATGKCIPMVSGRFDSFEVVDFTNYPSRRVSLAGTVTDMRRHRQCANVLSLYFPVIPGHFPRCDTIGPN